MANFTVELRYLAEYDEEALEASLADYPIWDDEYREVLNAKLIEHYYFNEIGLETPDRFYQRLHSAMADIMPYYNDLIKTQLTNFQTEIERTRSDGKAKTTLSGSDTTAYRGKDKTTSNSDALNARTESPNEEMTVELEDDGTSVVGGNAVDATRGKGKSTTENERINREDEITYGRTETRETVAPASDTEELKLWEQLPALREYLVNIDYEIITNRRIKQLFMQIYN